MHQKVFKEQVLTVVLDCGKDLHYIVVDFKALLAKWTKSACMFGTQSLVQYVLLIRTKHMLFIKKQYICSSMYIYYWE